MCAEAVIQRENGQSVSALGVIRQKGLPSSTTHPNTRYGAVTFTPDFILRTLDLWRDFEVLAEKHQLGVAGIPAEVILEAPRILFYKAAGQGEAHETIQVRSPDSRKNLQPLAVVRDIPRNENRHSTDMLLGSDGWLVLVGNTASDYAWKMSIGSIEALCLAIDIEPGAAL